MTTPPESDVSTDRHFSAWAGYYLHAPGASVAVYEDGTIDTARIQDKPLLGVYRLTHFKDKDSFEQLAIDNNWEDRGINEKLAEKIFSLVQPHAAKPCPPATEKMLADAKTKFGDTLRDAQFRVLERFKDTNAMPRLWLSPDASAQWMKNHSVISLSPDTTPDALHPLLNQQWKHIREELHEHAGSKIDPAAQAFEFRDDGNRGMSVSNLKDEKESDVPEDEIVPPNKGFAHKNTKAHIYHYRRQPIKERQGWVRDILEAQKKDVLEAKNKSPMEFGDLMRWLRVMGGGGLRQKDVGEKIGHSSEYINHAENFYSYIGKKAVHLYTNFVLEPNRDDPNYNPFFLPENENGIEVWAKKIILDAMELRLKRYPQETIIDYTARRNDVLNEVAAAIAAYKKGELPLAALPNVKTVFKQILPNERGFRRDLSTIANHLYGVNAPQKHSYVSRLINTPARVMLNTEVFQLGKYAGCDDATIDLLLRLPRGTGHFFDSDYRSEMTEGAMMQVFNHPDDFRHAGEWLKALRNARQLGQSEIATKMKVVKDAIRQHETHHSLFPKTIQKYLDCNPFEFPVDEKGQVQKEFADHFRNVMSKKIAHEGPAEWPTLANVMTWLNIPPEAEMIAEIKAQTAVDKDVTGITSFTLEGRSYKAYQTPEGGLRLAPETVDALKKNPHLWQPEGEHGNLRAKPITPRAKQDEPPQSKEWKR